MALAIICFCGAGLLKLEFVVPVPIVQATDFIHLHPERRLRHQRLRSSLAGDEDVAIDCGHDDLTCFSRAAVPADLYIHAHGNWEFE